MNQSLPSRRAALVSFAGTTLAVCLAGCAVGSAAPSAPAGSGGATTVPASEIPVGGGKIVGEYVVTQPTEGSFQAFSYLCTHQNLPVQQVSDAAIVCGRHGSSFSLADGSVLTGPATTPLPGATVSVDGDTLTIG